MHLESAHRRDNDDGIGTKLRQAALDVKELFSAEVGTESCFRHDEVCKLQRKFRRHNAVAAMRNVGKRSAMNKDWRAFKRLNDVRLDRILKEQRQRTRNTDFIRTNGTAAAAVADDNAAEPLLHIRKP